MGFRAVSLHGRFEETDLALLIFWKILLLERAVWRHIGSPSIFLEYLCCCWQFLNDGFLGFNSVEWSNHHGFFCGHFQVPRISLRPFECHLASDYLYVLWTTSWVVSFCQGLVSQTVWQSNYNLTVTACMVTAGLHNSCVKCKLWVVGQACTCRLLLEVTAVHDWFVNTANCLLCRLYCFYCRDQIVHLGVSWPADLFGLAFHVQSVWELRKNAFWKPE